MDIIKTLKDFKRKSKKILFTTPGHCQGKIIPFEVEMLMGRKIFEADVSEIDDFDNIRQPKTLFFESQKKISEIYESKQSFYLFNGSSSGIIALMLATVKKGEKVLLARNAHVSIYNALVLTGVVPVWINPERNNEFNICDVVDPEKIKEKLDEHHNIKAVWITSPTYEGVVSDVLEISRICKERKILLIVDEAHGALWNFSKNLPTPAIIQGADASVQSLHKTATALTQGAVLHIGYHSQIDKDKVQQSLNIINSTSPSFPIIASIEGAIEYLQSNKGKNRLGKLLSHIDKFRKDISLYKDINILTDCNIDKTKLFISIKGLSGYKLSEILINRYNIEDELANDKGVLCLTGIGTEKHKLDKLKNALIDIVKNEKLQTTMPLYKFGLYRIGDDQKPQSCNAASFLYIEPAMAYTPEEIFNMPSKSVDISDCIGKISKELIIPYPPGIPVLMPGEIIKEEHLPYLKDKKTIQIADFVTGQVYQSV
ncbi:MAG: aminotransferase class I/II-fold pyridoxal phosphate-dependent enzyme [Candidatus Gastranaerophilaceae bacterium]